MPPVQKKRAIEQFSKAEWSEVERGHKASWRLGAHKVCVLYQELPVIQMVHAPKKHWEENERLPALQEWASITLPLDARISFEISPVRGGQCSAFRTVSGGVI
jgi:hypothetical protein